MRLGRGVMRRFNFTIRRRLAGRLVRIPVFGRQKVGVLGEPFLLDLIESLLPCLDGVFVDVGANLGQTLCKVKIADPERAYVGIEPNPACHAYLEELVRVNEWPNVVLIPCGIADRANLLALNSATDRPADSQASFVPNLVADSRRPHRVGGAKIAPVFSYREVERWIDGPAAIVKVDVEGAELEVLRSMAEAINRDRPLLSIELLRDRALQQRHHDTFELLSGWDYALYVVEKRSDGRLGRLRRMVTFEYTSDRQFSDHVAVPREKLGVVAHLGG